jgi:hypothetical protein
MPGGTFFMSVLIEAEINEVLAWENVEVVVHMLKISCGSFVVSILYYVLTVKKTQIAQVDQIVEENQRQYDIWRKKQ